MKRRRFIIIHPDDNVATAVSEIAEGEVLAVEGGSPPEIRIRDAIPYGHKFAVTAIPKGRDITKYGECIGRASEDIEPGAYVHVHNVESLRGRGDLKE